MTPGTRYVFVGGEAWAAIDDATTTTTTTTTTASNTGSRNGIRSALRSYEYAILQLSHAIVFSGMIHDLQHVLIIARG